MTTVLTGGKFNALHEGHYWLLKKAKGMGDTLVVVLAHDAHNERPYAKPAAERKKQLEATGIPNIVIIGDPDDYSKVIDRFGPDIIVLGYDQKLPPGVEAKLPTHIRVVRLGRHGAYQTRG